MWSLIREWIFPVACIGCGTGAVALCERCGPRRDEALFFQIGDVPVLAAGSYELLFRRAIVAMKRGERAYFDAFAALLARTVPPGVTLVPLPTTRGRAARRGFDQSVELTLRAALRAGVPWQNALEKHGAPQHGLLRAQRLESHGRFRLRRGVGLPEHALVIDDVCTTGGTIADGIATLRAAGCNVAGALVLARTPAEPSRSRDGHRVRESNLERHRDCREHQD
ncbi:MAG: hypothetical protein NVSMB5_20950 [Candidatus Velthaea sp.]